MSQPYDPARTAPRGFPPSSVETRQDVDAALAARRELGPDYQDHIAAGLAERVEQLAAARSAELQRTAESGSQADQLERLTDRRRFVLGIVSLGAGIPITGIAGGISDLPGIVVVWAGIVGVNIAYALGNRRRDR